MGYRSLHIYGRPEKRVWLRTQRSLVSGCFSSILHATLALTVLVHSLDITVALHVSAYMTSVTREADHYCLLATSWAA
jgi:hypothetical protein